MKREVTLSADPLVTLRDNKRMAGAIRRKRPQEDPGNEEKKILHFHPATRSWPIEKEIEPGRP